MILQQVYAGIPGEWDLWHKTPYVGSKTGITNYSSGTRNTGSLYQDTGPMTQNIQVELRTGDHLYYFTRNNSNLSVTYTSLYCHLLSV